MKILIVSATEKEVNLLLQKIGSIKKTGNGYFSGNYGKIELDFLIAGVGIPSTIYHLSEACHTKKYDLIINCGIAGAFKENCSIGTVTYVESECFGDLGIDNRGEFQTIFEIGLCDKNSPPFSMGKLVNKYNYQQFSTLTKLNKVQAITVNKASGEETDIVKKWIKFQADIESMEGAGVFYVCLKKNIPFIEIRAISNLVESRDVKKWNIPAALIRLNETLENLLTEIEQKS